MPKIITIIQYEQGDIYNMPYNEQKELILKYISLRELQDAMKDLFPLSILLRRTDQAIMFAENFQL